MVERRRRRIVYVIFLIELSLLIGIETSSATELICAKSQCADTSDDQLFFQSNNSCINCSHCWNQDYNYCTYLHHEASTFCKCDHKVPAQCSLREKIDDISVEIEDYTCYSPREILPLPQLHIVQSNLHNFTINIPNVQSYTDYWHRLNVTAFYLRAFCPEAVCSDAFEDFANDTFLIKEINIYDRENAVDAQKRSHQLRYPFHWTDFLNDHNDENLDVGVSMDYNITYNQSSLIVTDQGTVEERWTVRNNHSEPILVQRRPTEILLPVKSQGINPGLIVLLIILTLLFVGMILACITRRHTMRNLVSQKKSKKKQFQQQQQEAAVVYKTKPQSLQREEEWKLLPTAINADKSESNSPTKLAQKNDIMHKYVDICRNATIIPLSHLDLLEINGQGQFGPIKRGYVGQKNECMVHCAKIPYKTEDAEAKVFLEQLDSSVKASSHPNVISFVGLCDQGEDLYVALQLETGPNLRNLLRESRSLDNFLQYAQSHGRISLMSSQRLLSIMLGVARGMSYLEENKVLHDNLAAVNIVIGENGTPKIGGYGMATLCDLYMRQTEKNHKRLRWLPPETLTEHLFSLKSQIWSFGVVLWEIVTLGGSPYYDMSDKEVMNKVPMGLRLSKPVNASDKLYEAMRNCWRNEAETRPNFNEILRGLQEFNLNPEEHIDLNTAPNFAYEPIKQVHDGSL